MTQKQLKPRKVPMEVINLTFSKAGTLTLKTALDKLGYNTYHGSVMMKRPGDNWRIKCMIDAKFYGKGKPFGKAEFDDLWSDFSALSDVPVIAFVEELVQAYPEVSVQIARHQCPLWSLP